MTPEELKACAVGFRPDMWDVEQWQKTVAAGSKLTFSEFLHQCAEWMAGRAPSPYVND